MENRYSYDAGMAHPMGPLHLADFIGLDVVLSIPTSCMMALVKKYAPCPLLVNMVNAGNLERKRVKDFTSTHQDPRQNSFSSFK